MRKARNNFECIITNIQGVNVLKSVFILIPDPKNLKFREKEVNVSTFCIHIFVLHKC